MAKTTRDWVELVWANAGSLRAQDIPYDASQSIKQALDNGGSDFGKDYQVEKVDARATTTSATYQTRVTLTTPALTGTYRVRGHAMIDDPSSLGKMRLRNDTDAVNIGGEVIHKASDANERRPYDMLDTVVFTGSAKTFKLQWADVSGGNTQGICYAKIEIWRVS